MSGYAGIVNQDGSGVDRRLLQRWLEFLRFRGPDGGHLWAEESVGLVHAHLDTSGRSLPADQPCSLDGKVWISADARIDGKEEIKDQLFGKNAHLFDSLTDAELILYAYRKWEQRCLDHMIGDFSFAIWDREKSRLFCARDHFGIKPFFYCMTDRSLLVSNTLNCLRFHPDTTDRIDDRFIADFLIYGMLVHQDRSAFEDIKRLPPAHFMTWSPEKGVSVRRYWQLPLPDPLNYKDRKDYLDRFLHLLHRAVDDRLDTDRAIVMMSGGLDSTSVAASACDSEQYRTGSLRLDAGTGFYRRLVPDDEVHYARQVAEKLGMGFHGVEMDRIAGDRWIGKQLPAPEPMDSMVFSGPYQQALSLSKQFRVVLTGQGGDPALYPAPSSFPFFLQKCFLGAMGPRILAYRLTNGHLPRMDIRKCFRQWIGKSEKAGPSAAPPWLNQSLFSRLHVDLRWTGLRKSSRRIDALRGGAYRQLTDPMWQNIFEKDDSGVTGLPAEARYPFFDLRLVSFLLSLPPVPWCVDKHLLREAMKNRLPQTVLRRPKTPLCGFSEHAQLMEDNNLSEYTRHLNDGVKPYIDMAKYRAILAAVEKLRPAEFSLITRPILLSQWLDDVDSGKIKPGGA